MPISLYQPLIFNPGNEGTWESIPNMRSINPGSTSAGLQTGICFFTYRTATVGGTVTTAQTQTGGTAAAATPTLCKVGLYTVDSSGNLTLVASTANTTSLWAGTFTSYETALTQSYNIIPGQRYAAGVLIVTAGAAPTLNGVNATWETDVTARSPRVAASISGQTDLPSSVAAGSLSNTGKLYAISFY